MRWVKLEPISQSEVSQKEKEKYHTLMDIYGASLVAQRVKNLPTMWETQVQFLGWEDPLEKEMATHSNILAREIQRVWHATVQGVTKESVTT